MVNLNIINNKVITEKRLYKQRRKAIIDKNSKGKIIISKVSSNIAGKIKNLLGLEIGNRNHVLSYYDIRHMINEHGDEIKESKKRQIAITIDDILKIPEIIEFYDDIIKGNINKGGETIRYIKRFENNILYIVEVVPEKSKALNIKTMWKKNFFN